MSVDNIIKDAFTFLEGKELEERKIFGQYYTPSNIAVYMAKQITNPKKTKVTILDAGAGSGILALESIRRVIGFGVKFINLILYEVDAEAITFLENLVLKLKQELIVREVILEYKILDNDFVTSRPDKENLSIDIAIVNPPYFKYNVKNSKYAKAVSDLYKGDPNIYASFMAIISNMLSLNGQMVSITPRSFTNGLYYKGFRDFIFSKLSLEFIHVFNKRKGLFKDKSKEVLQENVICKFLRKEEQTNVICVASSAVNFREVLIARYNASLLFNVVNGYKMLLIPENDIQGIVLNRIAKMQSFFEDNYVISTGPVVEYRSKANIVKTNNAENTIPLFKAHNIIEGTVSWSGKHSKDLRYLIDENSMKPLIGNQRYLFVRRFSTKEDRRRLIAGIYIPDNSQKFLAIDNKVNYISSKHEELSIEELYGLNVIFNSTLFDNYFRCISGNTQVNATEIRLMKFPTREKIVEIGKIFLLKVNDNADTNQMVDQIINEVLEI
ncbi:Eco57I restriction-modification methylase domain-containing protein [Francisella philomiragia]|uniref:Eco57I restriction-modification methylase domain-containing protein n=1 Tax=Francisella philomiragia TaxID=28110 RepID=UPI001B8CB904|nr:Eco57I restriction-modification methylase domain-containing protein [Francisella philomiragia]QUE31249.1 Eco57I restriction-modification methylase domain-containing protein [Francisella philomiragia]